MAVPVAGLIYLAALGAINGVIIGASLVGRAGFSKVFVEFERAFCSH